MRKAKSAFLTRFSAGNICIFTFYRQGLEGVFCKRDGKWCLASFRIRLCACSGLAVDRPSMWSVRGGQWGVWSRKCWDIEENVRVVQKKVGPFSRNVGAFLEEVGDILENVGDFLRNVGEKTRMELGLMWFAWERWSIAQPSPPMKYVGVATKTLENKNLCVNLCA